MCNAYEMGTILFRFACYQSDIFNTGRPEDKELEPLAKVNELEKNDMYTGFIDSFSKIAEIEDEDVKLLFDNTLKSILNNK
jgi:hypothetical protein